MNVDADVSLGSVRTLGKIPRLVDNLGASAKVARFDLIAHLAFANNIVLQIETDNGSQKSNSPYSLAYIFLC